MVNRFVAVANVSDTIATSDDGITWVAQSGGFPDRMHTVEFGNGVWLTCDDTYVGWSTDGIAWNLSTAPNDSISAFAYGAGCWIAIDDSGHIWRSTNNGVSWAAQTTGLVIDTDEPIGVAWDPYNSQFVVTGENFSSSTSFVLTSPDGIAWTTQPAISGTRSTNSIATDDAGTLIAAFSSKPFSGTALKVVRSIDGGVTWTKETTPFTGFNLIRDITWSAGDALFVAVGDGPMIATSPDGVTWTAQTQAFTFAIGSIAWGAGIYVAASGELETSSDAITWATQAPIFSGASTISVAFGTSSDFVPSFTADAIVARTQTATFSADATVTDAHLVHADAIISAPQSRSFSADAALAFSIIDVQTGRNPHDRAEQHFGTMPATLVAFDRFNSVEQKLRYAWDRLSLHEAGGYKEATFTASAMLRRLVTGTFKMDAALIVGGVTVASWTADAITRRTQSGSAQANAVLLRGRSGSAQANAVLRRAGAGSFTADSYILVRRTGSFTADGILFKTVTGSFTANSVIGTPGSESGLLGDHTLGQHELGGE